MATRDYTYYDFTLSLCSACQERVDAKIVFQDNNVFMLKNCLDHGPEKTLEEFRRKRQSLHRYKFYY